MNPNDGEGLDTWEARRQGMLAKGYNGNGCGTPLSIAVQQWPTPVAEDSECRAQHNTLLDSVREENWQTPLSSDANGPRDADGRRGIGLNTQAVADWSTPTARDKETLAKVTRGQGAMPGGTPLLVQVQDWQTPMPSDVTGGRTTKGSSRPGETGLRQQASKEWASPMASTNRKSQKAMTASTENGRRSGGGNSSPPGLEQQVELEAGIWPKEMPDPEHLPPSTQDWLTPQARDHKGISQKPAKGEFTGGLPDQLLELQISGPPDPASSSTPGSRPVVLNPAWVAALMGFPTDWLDGVAPRSKRLATPSSRRSPKSSRTASSISSSANNE